MREAPTAPTCPYGARECPKVQDLEGRVMRDEELLQQMSRTLYVIVGLLMVELGVTII